MTIINQEMLVEMSAMWNAGISTQQIADRFNLSFGSAKLATERNRHLFPYRNKVINEDDVDRAVVMRKAGHSYAEIHRILNVPYDTIRKRIIDIEMEITAPEPKRNAPDRHDRVTWTTQIGAKVTLPRVRFLEGSV